MSLIIPALITIDFPEDPNTFVKVQTRFRPDLLFVMSRPQWGQIHPKASYLIEDENGQNHPLEFINDQWYLLSWSAKSNCYFTCKDQLLDPTQWKLPFWELHDPFHPANRHCYKAYREQVKDDTSPSESTTAEQLELSLPKPSQSSITEPMPTLPPVTIAQLTEQFENAPVFANIAEAPDHEVTQPRQDYLPTALPEPT
jgi:hypothetical protein